jgi:multidrug resistance efflux pump
VKAAAVAALILLGVVWYVLARRVTTDDAQVDCHITAVAPQVPGYVVQLLINDNTAVKEGDVLVQIDPRTYQAEVDQAKANLDFAEAQANSAKLQIGLTRQTTSSSTTGASAQKDSDAADYASSQAQLEQSATANLQLAEANVAAKKATNERAQADLARYAPLLATRAGGSRAATLRGTTGRGDCPRKCALVPSPAVEVAGGTAGNQGPGAAGTYRRSNVPVGAGGGRARESGAAAG